MPSFGWAGSGRVVFIIIMTAGQLEVSLNKLYRDVAP